jgi:hypothetical protein
MNSAFFCASGVFWAGATVVIRSNPMTPNQMRSTLHNHKLGALLLGSISHDINGDYVWMRGNWSREITGAEAWAQSKTHLGAAYMPQRIFS